METAGIFIDNTHHLLKSTRAELKLTEEDIPAESSEDVPAESSGPAKQ